MANEWRYVSGDWWLICDSCGAKTRASQSKERWDGFRVCKVCFEVRHPQDFIKVKADKMYVPFTRPRPTDVFVSLSNEDESRVVNNVVVNDVEFN